jgi:hypothetical protein
LEIAYWADLTLRIATDIATRARRAPGASADSATSAFAAAGNVLDAISGTGGSQAALQAYIDAPANATKQAAAAAALANTQGQLDALIANAGALDAVLDSSVAEALPTVWYGSACAFLQPASGASSWWTANGWAATSFYQISGRTRSLPTTSPCTGTLRINGTGTHCVVALAAGRALAGQNRATRSAANFFEGINADASRDGNATNPVATFTSQPSTATFNDRLSN